MSINSSNERVFQLKKQKYISIIGIKVGIIWLNDNLFPQFKRYIGSDSLFLSILRSKAGN